MNLEITKGMKIEALGVLVTIDKVLYQHCDLGDEYHKRWADVEFEDTNGRYRHWQSWSDGGTLIVDGKRYKFEREV